VLWQRLLTAAVGVPVFLVLICLGGWWLAGAVALLSVLGMREFYRLISLGAARHSLSETAADPDTHRIDAFWHHVWPVFRVAGYALAVLYPLPVLPILFRADVAPVPAIMVGLAFVALWLIVLLLWGVAVGLVLLASRRRPPIGYEYTHIFVTFFGMFLLPKAFAYLVWLSHLANRAAARSLSRVALAPGAGWLLLVLTAVWITDTAAYTLGRLWGRHKLWPAVSPGKTVEGSVGGLAAAVLWTAVFGHWLGLSVGHGLALGAVLGVVGQLGDLAESKLKRWAGVKDSGAILPGHGGILDRFDSLLFNAPAAYYYLRLVAGI